MAVEVISEIVQKNGLDFALIDSNNLRGGLYSVKTIAERDSIPVKRIKQGMLCYVEDANEYYKLEGSTWSKAKFGGDGIPIYDQEALDDLGDNVPSKYITIANKSTDLNGTPISREIQNTGTYVDILFSAIRKLQSEVARLRNSFKYGIYSYNGTNTAVSDVVNGIKDPDDEPLWCIEEEDLSLIYSMPIGRDHELLPSENVNIGTEDILQITGEASWEDTALIIKDVSDPKLFLYLTTTSLDIQLQLIDSESQSRYIDLSTLKIPTADSYNIMICISRTTESGGSNYIYISVGNAQRDQILSEGYLNSGDKLQSTSYDCGTAYYIKSVSFNDLNISKLNFYSKYQDFSNQVIPSAPTDQSYKYKVAHITIRSVSDYNELTSIQKQLPNNELIFIESSKQLWIKNKDTLINIGSSGGITPGDDGMTQTEVINLLKEMGIVREDGQDLQINDISDLTFIHEATGSKFKFTVDGEGNLNSQRVPEEDELLESRVNASGADLKQNVRGFIGQLRIAENNNTPGNVKISITQDARIYSDRVKIGAFYAPYDTDKVFGCSRAFIELENTADCDFSLEGCYLHYTRPNSQNNQAVYHLPLTGTIKAGGTYLVVGKKYAENTDSNVYIKVDSFDQEWYVDRELIDFTINSESSLGYGFALTYGNSNLQPTSYLYKESDSTTLSGLGISSASKFPRVFDPSFIDAIYYKQGVKDSSNKGYWADMVLNIKPNTMYKNMFELDPAKQAFQSCNTADSSRTRWQSSNDVWILDLSKSEIEFPHSNDIYPISKFTPKASFEDKNVSTDKSKLDVNIPNMVTCSFGRDIYRIRCFNWISVGYFDEYVWLRKKGTDTWSKFESYKEIDTANEELTTFPRRKEYSKELNNAAYARITGRFPGDGTFYTSHKCVVHVCENSVSSPQVWEYIVGRADKDGNPDTEHTSEIQTFTLRPEAYSVKVYQITDQQGFHWVEYQVWAAAASKILQKIEEDINTYQGNSGNGGGIVPILINTGDMTQNGTRINEWYDYYQAGRELFKKYEQMNVVGNNDLCGTNVSELGTGDDQGKSNSFYFHLFYCYDIDESVFTPIVNGKYIPSLYYFDSKSFRFVMINSEITPVNCQQWYNLTDGDNIINIYTGFTIGSNKVYHGEFTSIYTMLYDMLTVSQKECVAVCHEMPFTVITNSSIADGQQGVSRSLSNANALVGSHTNQISNADTGKGTYWLSRLLEYKGVQVCLGGHKHTYACTYPVREYFLFGNGKNSKDNYSEYVMERTLENDNVTWMLDGKDLTKYPLTKRNDVGAAPTGFYPYTPVPDLTGGVFYFMCQATGYKLTSNKELPSANQKFSMIVPYTTNSGGKDAASNEQKYPMFVGLLLNEHVRQAELIRIANIFNSSFKFAQNTYSTDDMKLQWFSDRNHTNYGEWNDSEYTFELANTLNY